MSWFGSVHSGVCNFLIGDGSVRGLAVTTPHSILVKLADVDDGEAIPLP